MHRGAALTIRIDGRDYSTRAGKTVLQVAERNDIKIP
jgi:NADH dehydrogenase/NADH:ubiquinone oxidoreductase subunit G